MTHLIPPKISSGSVEWLTKGTSNTSMVVMSQRLPCNEPMMMNNHHVMVKNWPCQGLQPQWEHLMGRVSAVCICVCIYTCICICMSLHIWICLCVTHYCQDLHVPAGSADCVCWLRVCSLLRESKGFCHITLGKALLFTDGWEISTFCRVKNIQYFFWRILIFWE